MIEASVRTSTSRAPPLTGRVACPPGVDGGEGVPARWLRPRSRGGLGERRKGVAGAAMQQVGAELDGESRDELGAAGRALGEADLALEAEARTHLARAGQQRAGE